MKLKVISIVFLTVMVIGAFGIIPALPLSQADTQTWTEPLDITTDDIPESMYPMIEQALAEDNPYLPADFDIGTVLGDRDNVYKMFYEPWKSKAAIHAKMMQEQAMMQSLMKDGKLKQ